MERKIFVLKHTRTYRRAVKYFLQGAEGKIEQRTANFTTEHKVSEKERNRNARLIPAEFITDDERIYDALLRCHGYGKKFVLEGDPEGKLKRAPFDISVLDSKKAALKNLFEYAGLTFDGSKDINVLEAEYKIHAESLSGRTVEKGSATDIPHKPVDVQKDIAELAEQARTAYKEKYGEEVPDEYTNDLGFLSALADPNFDAKAYMEKPDENPPEETKKEDPPKEVTVEEVQKEYFEVIGANPPNPKKNDIAWMQSKIAEAK